MTKIIYRIFVGIITLLLIALIYLSTIGIKTDIFNSKIISQVKKIEPNLEIKLSQVKVTLNPFNFEINAKTIGTDLIYKDKIIKLERIRSKISLKSYINNDFAVKGIFISTKSLAIKDLITFARFINNDPKIFIANQFIKKGYVVADLELEFDKQGNVKNNYKLNGIFNNGQISLFKKYNINKIDFIFNVNQKNLIFKDIRLSLNNKNILIPELISLKQNDEYLISGKLNTINTNLTTDDIKKLINHNFIKSEIENVSFSSKNNFKFKLNKKFKIKDLNIQSDIDVDNLKLKNFLNLKDIFPKIKKNMIFENHKIKLVFNNNNLDIDGKGGILLQNEIDKIEYQINKTKNKIKFNTSLNILENIFEIDLLNYKKSENSNLKLIFKGEKDLKKPLIFDEISLKEKNNIILVKNLLISNDNKITDTGDIKIDYTDKENFRNILQVVKKDNHYFVSGDSFNIDKIIEKLLNPDDGKKTSSINKNTKFIFDIKKVYLDKNNNIRNLKGFLTLNKDEISELNLESNFSNQKKIKLTIKKDGNEKITTLFSDKAKPLVSRYKFIKGFEGGDLDFYSIKKNNVTNSTLKINNFKIQEIPVLAKLLTLASLQGIADLLTGQGIRFTDFEMKFSSKGNLMTIEEMYAIGPAISILMDGYIESKKLISLRGTLVPATTINKTISSIPIIGNILVGKKVGEGVFGVSFKVKGPSKDLETTVNPIKTLTPRFITRTLEKIKKN